MERARVASSVTSELPCYPTGLAAVKEFSLEQVQSVVLSCYNSSLDRLTLSSLHSRPSIGYTATTACCGGLAFTQY